MKTAPMGRVLGERAAPQVGRLRELIRAVVTFLPKGWNLSEDAWQRRHRGIVVVLWLHVVGVPIFGLIRGVRAPHLILETGAIAVFAFMANSTSLSRGMRMAAAAIGLLSCSGVLVHLSDGSIEMHFHFFVMVPLVALYQDWMVFLLAIGYVAVHHGVIGTLDPHSVFNHEAAFASPWKWAGIHALFITGISAVCLVTWRVLEAALNDARAEARVKSEFLSVMSHEIRTPLTSVIGYTGLLLETDLSEEQREFANWARVSGDRLLTLINDVLDYSKIEAGRLDLSEEPFDVLELVEDTLGLMADTAHQRGTTLSSLCDNSVPRVSIGDSGRIAQVLANLVSNAVKFTAEGSVFVNVSAGPRGAGRHELVFAVKDTGIGIEPEALDRIFASFAQADASTSSRYGGTGLGLAIAKQLCELMGGTITVESTPGVGSTFYASIVVREADPRPRSYDEDGMSDLRVLVVGESGGDGILSKYMSQWGVRPRSTNVEDALASIRLGERFDVAFIDDSVEKAHAFALATELRQSSTDHPPSVIFVSDEHLEGSERVLFDAVLVRPLRQSRIHDLVAAAVARGDASATGRTRPAVMASEKPLRILVAEDNHVSQKMVLARLNELGYDADIASNGIEAVSAARLRNYDVILMDVDMPEMDGVSATKAIREDSASHRPTIIALTAGALADVRRIGDVAGMDDYLGKPLKASQLAAALSRCSRVHP